MYEVYELGMLIVCGFLLAGLGVFAAMEEKKRIKLLIAALVCSAVYPLLFNQIAYAITFVAGIVIVATCYVTTRETIKNIDLL